MVMGAIHCLGGNIVMEQVSDWIDGADVEDLNSFLFQGLFLLPTAASIAKPVPMRSMVPGSGTGEGGGGGGGGGGGYDGGEGGSGGIGSGGVIGAGGSTVNSGLDTPAEVLGTPAEGEMV